MGRPRNCDKVKGELITYEEAVERYGLAVSTIRRHAQLNPGLRKKVGPSARYRIDTGYADEIFFKTVAV